MLFRLKLRTIASCFVLGCKGANTDTIPGATPGNFCPFDMRTMTARAKLGDEPLHESVIDALTALRGTI